MNIKKINEYWPILEALKEGKTIQLHERNKWNNIVATEITFSLPPEFYRIKPVPATCCLVWRKYDEKWARFAAFECEEDARSYIGNRDTGNNFKFQTVTMPED